LIATEPNAAAFVVAEALPSARGGAELAGEAIDIAGNALLSAANCGSTPVTVFTN
jgi:hypothetical protein